MPSDLAPIPYALDEDIALRAAADFALLCPKDQKVAAGTDGAFLPGDPWTMRSAAVNFLANKLSVGQVVQLAGPAPAFNPPGESFVVVDFSYIAVSLRRKGQAPYVGQPPAPMDGLSGVEFLITTFAPQILRAGADLDARFGIDPATPGRAPGDLLDPGELRDATVLLTLHRQYLDMSREAGGQADALAAKAQIIKVELDDLLARMVLHWRPTGPGRNGPTTRFSTRLSR